MKETLRRSAVCPICASTARFHCRKESARYYRCAPCGTIFQYPMPTAEAMAQYVDREYASGPYKEYVRARDLKLLTFRKRARQIVARQPVGRLLDVGCACGYFVEAAVEVGLDASGLELSPVAIASSQDYVRPRLMQGDVNHLVRQKLDRFDVVTAFDIVEHVFEPLQFLESLTPLLRPGGLLVLSTPDTGHLLRALMGREWPMLQPMQHTVLFSGKSLTMALERVGFRDVELVPARKVLTADYLAGQVGALSPAMKSVYEIGARIVPSSIRQLPVGVNIGELMAFARWPGGDTRGLEAAS